MENEPRDSERPDDATVLASVQRVEDRVLAGIRIDRKRQRRVRVGVGILAGLGLFAGGVAVGAAALAPIANPGANPGVTEDGRGGVLENEFAIDCYTSKSDTHPSEEDETADSSGALFNANELIDEHDPSGACAAMQSRGDIDQALFHEALKLDAQGIDHGFILVLSDHTYQFERGFGPNGTRVGWTFDDGIETQAAGVVVTATIPHPTEPDNPTVVCAVASNWVKVYPRGSESAQAVCSSVGLTVWHDSR
jgi:hypothetical protein